MSRIRQICYWAPSRLCTLVDAEALDAALTRWMRDGCRPRAVAIDREEARGAKNADGSRVFLMAALGHDTGCVIGQEHVGAKTNEIPNFPALLRQQAEALHAGGAHSVSTVKANQPGLRDRIASQTWAMLAPQHTLREKGDGRTTTWQITVQRAQSWIGFPHARQTIRLTRDRIDHRTGDATREQVYAITSLSPEDAPAAELAALIRGHWGIENRLHWVRDVTYDEDRSQIRTGIAPRVMAALRNLAISIHRFAGVTSIAHATRAAVREPETARQLTGLRERHSYLDRANQPQYVPRLCSQCRPVARRQKEVEMSKGFSAGRRYAGRSGGAHAAHGVSAARLRQKSGRGGAFGGYVKVHLGDGQFTMRPSRKRSPGA